MNLTQRQQSSADTARQRFAEATRATSFSINLGIMEIRLLRDNDWKLIHSRSASEIAAFQRLVDKGLVVNEGNTEPSLSMAGQLMRELLVISKHIVREEKKQDVDPGDLLEILRNGMQWYGQGGNAWLDHVYLKRATDTSEAELRIRTKKPDYDVHTMDSGSRPLIRQEFAIPRSAIRDVTKPPPTDTSE